MDLVMAIEGHTEFKKARFACRRTQIDAAVVNPFGGAGQHLGYRRIHVVAGGTAGAFVDHLDAKPRGR